MASPIWNTPTGSIGSFPAGLPMTFVLSASPVLPSVSIEYTLLGGSLPPGLSMNVDGIISGTPSSVIVETTTNFSIRATDNYGNIKDRTFSIVVSGSAVPSFVTPEGVLLSTLDSIWVEFPIVYSNPDSNNPVAIYLIQGTLPSGLEVDTRGIIRGYADPPTVAVNLPIVTTAATATSTDDIITCLSTAGFTPGRPVKFSGVTLFGGLESDIVYYIKDIINSTSFTICNTPNGSTLNLTAGSGFMTVTLQAISVGQPTIKTFNFTLQLDSPLGNDTKSYSITVINQNTPTSQGGPGKPPNSRTPVIFNTRPETYNLNNNNPYYGYYLLPPVDSGYDTYPLNVNANIGTIQSDNFFAFKIIGHDFDSNGITYLYADLPAGFVGNTDTGWITGTPVLSSPGINEYSFSVAVYKTANPTIQSSFFNFSFKLANEITENIYWLTGSNLGTIFNGTISAKSVLATSDVELQYRITNGSLPPNLSLLSNGEITGYVADQPTTELLPQNTETIFTFTIEAYSPVYPIIKSSRTFNLTVLQKYSQPTDILYIKATPSIEDRNIINTLLYNESLIPTEYLYRPNDVYFGKATEVIYEHAYGIYASDVQEYLTAVTKNHYWRKITLGEIKTAQARDSNGNVIYEVVYSQVIDNLVNPQGQSIAEQIYWPRPINLFLGPWYTSVTNIYTSYEQINGQQYYTSLTPGYARILYPNSLLNMRNRVGQVLGQEYDSSLLPLWMTSQQANGSTLGFTQAWVICYTKPGFAEVIKTNINNNWKREDGMPYTLNEIDFSIDRFSVNKSITYNYDKNVSPPAWTGLPSATPVPNPLDSKNFYVLFPRKTILPDETQY